MHLIRILTKFSTSRATAFLATKLRERQLHGNATFAKRGFRAYYNFSSRPNRKCKISSRCAESKFAHFWTWTIFFSLNNFLFEGTLSLSGKRFLDSQIGLSIDQCICTSRQGHDNKLYHNAGFKKECLKVHICGPSDLSPALIATCTLRHSYFTSLCW